MSAVEIVVLVQAVLTALLVLAYGGMAARVRKAELELEGNIKATIGLAMTVIGLASGDEKIIAEVEAMAHKVG